MSLESCLPVALRGPATTITPVAAGLSGAGVYRVDAAGESFVLKVTGEGESFDRWRGAVELQRQAAEAGLAPPVLHVDEQRRAVVNAFVVDRSFPAFFADPRTREGAIDQLGRTLRRLHSLPLLTQLPAADPRALLAAVWSALPARLLRPSFVVEAVERLLAETPPARERALVLSHNDLNPSNLVYDGQNILFLDWATAGPNDPFYDLGVIALFLRMDEATCRRLLAAYDDAPATGLSSRFVYARRLAGTLCGSLFLRLAAEGGHPGARGDETLASTATIAELYPRMRTGAFTLATPDGKWTFGLALVKASLAL
jgi:aminoglycoside phosphotransferase